MKTIFKVCVLCVLLLEVSCKKFLDIDPPKDSLVQETVFTSDDLATSAVTGMYFTMISNGFASGGSSSISSICGLAADELQSHNLGLNEFYTNQISSTNNTVESSLYLIPYQIIFTTNSILEGLHENGNLTPQTIRQLEGEALFTRAFVNFYLVNLYGPISINLTSDYRITQNSTRTNTDLVYVQIIDDLLNSERLLSSTYISGERIRPNKAVAQAMLARTYLTLEDWDNAEKYSSMLINNSDNYKLTDLNDTFLKNSLETIWQLMPLANNNTQEGDLFILSGNPQFVSLDNNFVLNAFEPNDKRKSSWINSYSNGTDNFYYPFKYKVSYSNQVSEYSTVLRLAEQYLIRAEARANQNNLIGSIEDIDVIRKRAGLNLIADVQPNINKTGLLDAIIKERRVELFTEWGHRWFDLKRTRRINSVLSSEKSNWQMTDEFFPIPQTEINRNRKIKQNEGY